MSASPEAPRFALPRRLAAEALGTAFLVATVVGSGIMADRLTADDALALLGNTLPTGAILVVLISVLGPISGAHFNPAVTLAFRLKGSIASSDAALYVVAQVAGGIAGTWAAHAMFDLPMLQAAANVRSGVGQWFAEVVATFGLVGVILGGLAFRAEAIAWLVGLYITAAYWFTASTSFANPAVAIARALTDSFSGIRPVDLPGFILAELFGSVLAVAVFGWLLQPEPEPARRESARSAIDGSGEAEMSVTIYHNPACGTSRNVLAMIRQSGEEPEIIEYLKTPPDRATLKDLIRRMGIAPRELLRRKGTPYDALGLDDPKWSDDELIDFMLREPILINRPIVITPKGVRLCRPSETVLGILPNPDIGPFTKEDGEVVR